MGCEAAGAEYVGGYVPGADVVGAEGVGAEGVGAGRAGWGTTAGGWPLIRRLRRVFTVFLVTLPATVLLPEVRGRRPAAALIALAERGRDSLGVLPRPIVEFLVVRGMLLDPDLV